MNASAKELADMVQGAGPIQGPLIAKAASTVVKIDSALWMARALLERTGQLDTPICSPNGPTIGVIIDRALAVGKAQCDVVAEEV
jgi:hypothetical protein